MKLKDGFVLRTVAGETVVIPSGDTIDLNVMITLNETGKFLWEHLEKETDIETLVRAMLAEYDVEEAAARSHIETFVQKLCDNVFLS